MGFGFSHADATVAHALGQARTAVLTGVPLVHAGKDLVAMVNRDHRTFGQGVQVAIGDNGGHFDDDIGIRVQTGHFQVDPDQVLRVLHVSAPRQCCAV
ncbi:hypothetical protein D9M73_255790 [compost metagenome]